MRSTTVDGRDGQSHRAGCGGRDVGGGHVGRGCTAGGCTGRGRDDAPGRRCPTAMPRRGTPRESRTSSSWGCSRPSRRTATGPASGPPRPRPARRRRAIRRARGRGRRRARVDAASGRLRSSIVAGGPTGRVRHGRRHHCRGRPPGGWCPDRQARRDVRTAQPSATGADGSGGVARVLDVDRHLEAHVRDERLQRAQRRRGRLAPRREVARTATTTAPRACGPPRVVGEAVQQVGR